MVESISLVLPSIRSLFVTKFSRISTQTAVRAKSAISRAIAPVQSHKFYPQLIFFFPKREFFTAAVPIPYVSYMAYAISCCTIDLHFFNNLHMYIRHSLCGLFDPYVLRIFFSLSSVFFFYPMYLLLATRTSIFFTRFNSIVHCVLPVVHIYILHKNIYFRLLSLTQFCKILIKVNSIMSQTRSRQSKLTFSITSSGNIPARDVHIGGSPPTPHDSTPAASSNQQPSKPAAIAGVDGKSKKKAPKAPKPPAPKKGRNSKKAPLTTHVEDLQEDAEEGEESDTDLDDIASVSQDVD